MITSDPRKIIFCVLDDGMSIPKTLKSNPSMSLKIMLKQLTDDLQIIKFALTGKWRSSTRKKGRGRGLTRLNNYTSEGQVNNLYIISNRGYYCSMPNKSAKLGTPLKGTMVYWEMKRS